MQKTIAFAGIAALALAAAVATPGYAWVHHHRMLHRTAHQASESTPAERQETAQLNRQQLGKTETNNAGSMATNASDTGTGMSTQPNSLATEPTTYQRTGTGNSGMTGNPGTGTMGSQPGSANGATQTPGSAVPPGAVQAKQP